MDDMSLDRVEDFGLGPIHDDPFNGVKIICTPLNKLGEMGGLVNREKMEKGFKTPQVSLPWSLRTSNLPLVSSMVSPNRMV